MTLDLPRTVGHAVETLLAGLSPEQRGQLRAADEDALTDMHFTLGMAARNQMRLWENGDLLRAVADGMRPVAAAEIARLTALAGGDTRSLADIQAYFGRFLTQESVHPDDASHFIIRQARDRLQAG